jgi:hypothetical protein
MPSTYEPIATNTLGSDTASVTFSSISGSYTDLILIVRATHKTTATNMLYRVGNGSVDTGTNYSITGMYADSGSVYSFRNTSQTSFISGYVEPADSHNFATIQLMNYSNTTTNKTNLVRTGSNLVVTTNVALWRSTSAINIITLFPASGNFGSGSTFTLYGIKAA